MKEFVLFATWYLLDRSPLSWSNCACMVVLFWSMFTSEPRKPKGCSVARPILSSPSSQSLNSMVVVKSAAARAVREAMRSGRNMMVVRWRVTG